MIKTLLLKMFSSPGRSINSRKSAKAQHSSTTHSNLMKLPGRVLRLWRKSVFPIARRIKAIVVGTIVLRTAPDKFR
jgi:hypothetical protein